jgi:hypothetical protein
LATLWPSMRAMWKRSIPAAAITEPAVWRSVCGETRASPARAWLRQKVADGTATDDDRRKVVALRQLAMAAREAGVTAPAFE